MGSGAAAGGGVVGRERVDWKGWTTMRLKRGSFRGANHRSIAGSLGEIGVMAVGESVHICR